MKIPKHHYKRLVAAIPIFCVDVVIVNSEGEYLLVKRANHPLRGRYWLVGGRVLKGEGAREAAVRKVRQEVGIQVDRLAMLGYYEGLFRENPFAVPSGVHTVSIVFEAEVSGSERIRLDSQSTAWKYSKRLPADFKFEPFNVPGGGRPQGVAALPGSRLLRKSVRA